MLCVICLDLLLDDYGKPELEPSYYDYDILDDADKGKMSIMILTFVNIIFMQKKHFQNI